MTESSFLIRYSSSVCSTLSSESEISDTASYGTPTTTTATYDLENDSDLAIQSRPKLSACQILIINLPWFGLSLMYLILTVEVVPAQVQAMVGMKVKGTVLGLMVAVGAILTLIISPVIGLKSDRLDTKLGKRRPVMLASSLLLCSGLMGMALSTSNIHLQGNMTEEKCVQNLTAKRCEPYTNLNANLQLNGPHVKVSENTGILQTESVNIPFFKYIASGKITGYTGLYVGCYLFVVITYAGVAVPYNALIADRTHPSQRGINSGVMGTMVLLGNVGGACLGLFIADLGLYVVYGIISGVVLLCISITLICIGEIHPKHDYESLGCNQYIKAFFEPFQDLNFRWLFLTRFLMQQGVSTIFTFIQYWVSDMVIIPNCWSKEKAVAILMLPLVVAAAICSMLFGFLSDKIKRRKPLVLTSAVLMSIASASLTSIHGGQYSYYTTLGLVFLSGIGYGTYLSVDFALLLDILPARHNKAKDIAVWNQALILPQVLATPLGGFILDFFEQFDCALGLGYIILFALTSIYFLLSGMFVIKIKIR